MAADVDTSGRELSDTAEIEDYDAATVTEVHHDSDDVGPVKTPTSHARVALAVGLAIAVVLGALVGWLGVRMYQWHNANDERDLYVQVAKQGALNLTTVGWEQADSDVQRILDSATGEFYDDFSKRSQAFIDVVKKARSKSEGTIVEAGLESQSDDQAEVLVVARVGIMNVDAPEQEPRTWRMRILVQKVGDAAKVSRVAFVP